METEFRYILKIRERMLCCTIFGMVPELYDTSPEMVNIPCHDYQLFHISVHRLRKEMAEIIPICNAVWWNYKERFMHT